MKHSSTLDVHSAIHSRIQAVTSSSIESNKSQSLDQVLYLRQSTPDFGGSHDSSVFTLNPLSQPGTFDLFNSFPDTNLVLCSMFNAARKKSAGTCRTLPGQHLSLCLAKFLIRNTPSHARYSAS
jgi:hypothetical protein